MKVKYKTTRECAQMLKGAASNCGSSADSLRSSGMGGYADHLAAAAARPVEAYMHGEMEISAGVEYEAEARGIGLEGMVILAHFHNCVPRQKTLLKWAKEVQAVRG